MNALNITLPEFENQRKESNLIPLYPNWNDYEERKQKLRKMNLSSAEYEHQARMLVDELNL